MGDRNCAFEGCNALEFRTSGYCLRHKGDLPYEETRDSGTPEKTSPKPITEIWWIPLISLASFPLFSFGLWYVEQIDVYDADPSFLYDLIYYLSFPFAILILLSPILLPIYAVYLVRITRQRIENGEWNLFLTMFHLLSFIAPLSMLLIYWLLVGSFGA